LRNGFEPRLEKDWPVSSELEKLLRINFDLALQILKKLDLKEIATAAQATNQKDFFIRFVIGMINRYIVLLDNYKNLETKSGLVIGG
jgi:hypothetical protein